MAHLFKIEAYEAETDFPHREYRIFKTRKEAEHFLLSHEFQELIIYKDSEGFEFSWEAVLKNKDRLITILQCLGDG